MDREKVIRGFECCHVIVHDLGPEKTSCGICPYKDVQTEEQFDLGGIECIAVLHDDALALLKEQQEQIDRLIEESASNAEMAEGYAELLKEQEAELSFREAKAITHTATKLDDATCPSCGNVVGEKIRTGAIGQSVVQVRWDYCRFCGQKLDWMEGR